MTVGAGTSIAKIESFVEPRGFHLPLAAPWEGSSAGGLVAANLNSPRRMRYGGVRDLTLCATVAMTDGRVVRAGRPLVKNVAGYDLPKLFVGSNGTLGVLVDVTFKLAPAPRALETVSASCESLDQALGLARQALSKALVASAVVIERDGDVDGRYELVFTAEGLAGEVEIEMGRMRRAVARTCWDEATDSTASGERRWATFLGSTGPEDLLTRTGVPITLLGGYLAELDETAGRRIFVDYGGGLVWTIDRPAGPEDAASRLEALRSPALERQGYTVAVDAPRALRDALDLWGDPPGGLELMRKLKKRFDPAGILEPGRSVAG